MDNTEKYWSLRRKWESAGAIYPNNYTRQPAQSERYAARTPEELDMVTFEELAAIGYIPAPDAAKKAGLSPNALRHVAYSGRIRYAYAVYHARRRLVFNVADLEKYLASRNGGQANTN